MEKKERSNIYYPDPGSPFGFKTASKLLGKKFFDLIIDEDNNENEKELNETDYNDSSSNEEERSILNLSSENAEKANNSRRSCRSSTRRS